ncbi:hypothetical protein [Marinobacter sp. ANT_B65]|uniref:hypothetical protein n=1 Tax=Marinobacter sp. ANT_B65 TaxID=2039467 RepID=UPI00117FAE4D|nr:hypothetical protein [Marinobacter sp. ANT_B65]
MTTRPVKNPSAPKWLALEGGEVLRSVGSALDGLSVTETTERRLERHVHPSSLQQSPHYNSLSSTRPSETESKRKTS